MAIYYEYNPVRIDERIRELELYLGPKCKYNTDCATTPEKYLLEYLHLLKLAHFNNKKIRLLNGVLKVSKTRTGKF